jgi:hypothetical protein
MECAVNKDLDELPRNKLKWNLERLYEKNTVEKCI